MADERPPFYSYKEVRVSTDALHPASIVSIRLPSHANGHHTSRSTSRRDQSSGALTPADEASFAKAHLATSAAIYFRHSKRHPRSYLWRVLEDGKVLSIQCVDLSKTSTTAHDPSVTLQLTFPSPIRPAGVVFADHEKHTSLYVFVVTASNDLYTLTLPAPFFHQPSATEGPIGRWCTTFLPSSFSFRYPHRLVARNPEELLVSLHDGGLLRLTREKDSDGASWVETAFNEGGWGSTLRGLVPWQGNHTVRFGNANLEQTTATALSFAPGLTQVDGAPEHVYTICLNHTLKAWNLSTGKIGFPRDLLNQPRTPQDMAKHMIDPNRASLMTVIDQRLRGERDHYYLVTFSPVGSGEFKFWAVSNPDHDDGIEDLYPDEVFEPPPPSSEIWTVAEFHVASAGDPGLFMLWLLWKNNTHYRVQSLRFDLLHLSEDWQNTWAATSPETLAEEPLPVVSSLESSDPTEKWLEYLFLPGRYTEAVLETSLSIYQQNLNVPSDQYGRRSKSLTERICSSVGSSALLAPDVDGGMDFHRYRIDVDFQWRRFYRIVVELNKQRGEALSLAYDAYSEVSWVVAANGLSAVRDCSVTEVIWHNKLSMIINDEAFGSCRPDLLSPSQRLDTVYTMAELVKAASSFTDCFSDVLLRLCHTVLDSECFQEVSLTAPARIQTFYDRCNFLGHITEEDVAQLKDTLDQDGFFNKIDTDLFQTVMALFPLGKPATTCEATMTTFGKMIVVRGAQETVYLSKTILFDLLMLLVFIAIDDSFGPDDEEADDEGKDNSRLSEIRHQIDVPEVYLGLISLLREYEVLIWLANTEEVNRPAVEPATKGSKAEASQPPTSEHRVSTLFQLPCARKWKPRWAQPRHTMSSLLTTTIGDLIASLQLQQPEVYKNQILKAQLYYVSRGDLALATELTRFQSSNAWSVYVKGRIALAQTDYTTAAVHFKKAGFQLANREGLDLNLIHDAANPLIEKPDTKFFATGLHSYYYHIVRLFDAAAAHSHVVDFSRACLQLINTMPSDDSLNKLRPTLHTHLFTSQLATSRFASAYTSLLLFADRARQLAHLTTLVHTMCTPPHSASALLLSFPLLTLQKELDAVLHAQTLVPSASGTDWTGILYALRVKRGDFRGAAEVLYERLVRLRSREKVGPAEVERAYLALINALASVGEGEAWVLVDEKEEEVEGREMDAVDEGAETATVAPDGVDTTEGGRGQGRRRVVTLGDIRRAYQEELDRRERLEGGRFAFAGEEDGEDQNGVELGAGERMEVDVF